MFSRRPLWILIVSLACGSCLAQVPASGTGSGGAPGYQPPKLAPVPYDSLELVTGDAQPVQDAQQRAALLTLLSNARALSNVRAQPYDLKTTFKSFGSLPSDGTWSLEDISPSRNVYRWTAQGPSYSAIYLYNDKLLSSNQPTGAMPLRLTQVRDAIFFLYPGAGQFSPLREATGYLHGVELHCILLGQSFGARSLQGGRNWEESESCVDPKTGLLAIYSPVPGLYVQYDYLNAVRFHHVIIPGKLTISEAGRIVIEANTESVSDPAAPTNRIFDPSGLHSLGVGAIVNPSWRVRESIFSPSPHPMGSMPMPDPNAVLQVVVVHAIASPEGQVSESEILASTNPALNQAALERANGWKSNIVGPQVQPGTTSQWREVIFTLESANPPL